MCLEPGKSITLPFCLGLPSLDTNVMLLAADGGN